GGVQVGVVMNDVVADAGMHRNRNAGTPRRGEEGKSGMGVAGAVDAAADVLAESERFCRGLADPVVQLAGLAPEAELAGTDVAVDAFGGGADAGQLGVVDWARAVHGDEID